MASWVSSARVKKSRSGSSREKTSITNGSSSLFKRPEARDVRELGVEEARVAPDKSSQGWELLGNGNQACSLLDEGKDRTNHPAGRDSNERK